MKTYQKLLKRNNYQWWFSRITLEVKQLLHSSLLNTLQRVMSYLATTDSIFYWISRSTSRTKTQPVQFNLIVSHRKCSLRNGKYRHAKAGSSSSKTRLRRKNPQWSAFNVPRMTSCSLNLWLFMQKVHNFYGISCSGNWKLRVTTVWENRQLSFFLFFLLQKITLIIMGQLIQHPSFPLILSALCVYSRLQCTTLLTI